MTITDDVIKAGDMQQRIAIQAATIASQNDYGEPVNTWATIDGGERWAEAKPLTGRELQIAQQISSAVTFAFILRYIAGVTPRHRVFYRSRYFDINAVMNIDESFRKTVLLCTVAA